jgi:hypothetical protein
VAAYTNVAGWVNIFATTYQTKSEAFTHHLRLSHPNRWRTALAAAAFYDLEGTLVSTNLVHTLGFYSRNQPGLLRSIRKSASTLLSIPVFAVTDQYSRMVFNDLFFKRYKGESEDRLRFFSEELFEDVLKPAVFPGARARSTCPLSL